MYVWGLTDSDGASAGSTEVVLGVKPSLWHQLGEERGEGEVDRTSRLLSHYLSQRERGREGEGERERGKNEE